MYMTIVWLQRAELVRSEESNLHIRTPRARMDKYTHTHIHTPTNKVPHPPTCTHKRTCEAGYSFSSALGGNTVKRLTPRRVEKKLACARCMCRGLRHESGFHRNRT